MDQRSELLARHGGAVEDKTIEQVLVDGARRFDHEQANGARRPARRSAN
jgi:hypothetical protein